MVVSGPDVGAGHPGGWLGPSQGWISSSPRSGCGVGSVAQGGRCPGVRPKHLSEPPESPGEPVIRRFHAELGRG